ncbi:MAG: beta-lactamase family protein [Candidatus Hydrogenedentes bacterium]|nr:beta-lactamase family protein [Candidatus Hydrogenedentota bacterium]
MNPDNFQEAWKAQSSQTRVTVNADLLLQEVQRSQESFRGMIFWRDFREVGVAIVMLPLWFVMGYALSLPWTWYLTVPALLWIMGFIFVDRMRHPQKPPGPGDSLLTSAKDSLAQVEHQIWLLRNVAWWYLLPFTISILAFFTQSSWQIANNWGGFLGLAIPSYAFLFVLYGFVYWLNQYAVRKQLEPRRQELLTLIATLRDEPAREVSGDYPILTVAKKSTCSRRRLIVATILFFAILFIGVPAILYTAHYFETTFSGEYPKLSPFAAVRWQESQPEVMVDGEWYKLVSLNSIPAADIVAFSQETFGDKWQKRFEEDLVELLTLMEHPPDDTVTLVVQTLDTAETRTLENVPMTFANRKAIRDAADAREYAEEPTVPLAELIPSLRAEKGLVGLAAMVMVDGEVVASAVDGERKSDSGVPLTIDDQWHLGSITKSITATMIARLIEAGEKHWSGSGDLRWSGTVGEAYAYNEIHENWKPVTLRQLLTHSSGAPPNFSSFVALKYPELGLESFRERQTAVLNVLAKKPATPPGERHVYSNVGYTIAGAMAEKSEAVPWSELVTREVFEPLGLSSAGFGPPTSPDDTLDQPRGHTGAFGWKIAMADDADNTFIIGPAGIVRMTLKDLCTYATEHLRGHRGEGTLLSAETYQQLHTPELDNYACGWVKKDPDAAIPHTVYWHNGSNTMWYALVVFIPDTNMVVAVTSNDGDIQNAESAAWQVVRNAVRH